MMTNLRFLILFLLPFYIWSRDIGDFAPVKIGKVWNYNYSYDFYEHGGWYKSIRLKIKIVIDNVINKNNLKYIIFKKEENGEERANLPGNRDYFSIITRTIYDTLIESNGIISIYSWKSIYPNPLFYSHTIGSDSLKKDTLEDSLYIYKSTITNGKAGDYDYLQNKGLRYFHYSTSSGISGTNEVFSLVSIGFVSIKNWSNTNIKPVNPPRLKIILTKNNKGAPQLIMCKNKNNFLLNGKNVTRIFY